MILSISEIDMLRQQLSSCWNAPAGAVINIGDKVVTSGFSDIYPSGLPVGAVEGVYEDRSSFQKIVNVTLPNDMSSFQYVFVITEKLNEMD